MTAPLILARIGLMFPAQTARNHGSMGNRCRFLSLLSLAALSLSACRQAKVQTYTIPKEKDPEFPSMAAGDASGQQAPAGAPSMASTAVQSADGPALDWLAPDAWQVEPPAPGRKASYLIPGTHGKPAEVTITAFGGDVGGELGNVNRWRGQVHLAPISPDGLEAALTRTQQNGLSLAIAEADNPQGGQHIIGVMVPFQGSTWFFKLSGSEDAVTEAKTAFLAFVKTIKAP
jgi:hypothetical protein